MKTTSFTKIVAFFLLLTFVTGCQDKVMEKYKAGVPVYMTYADLRTAVGISSPISLEKPGKIYFKDNYIYINEYFKGVHVIDNTNTANPVEKKFIKIPGNVDIAIKGNILYADSYVDLVAIDISNLNDVKEKYRIKNILPYATPVNPVNYTEDWPDPNKGVVIDWEIKEITQDVKPTQYPGPILYESLTYNMDKTSNFTANATGSSGGQGGATSVGVAGSMARFAILDNTLYVLSTYQINVVDITDINVPVTKKQISNYSGIETIFLNQGFMYLGARNGMSIYNVSDPFNPQFISTVTHFTSCDPVVVEDNYAYVTLRGGVTCRNTVLNQLDVVDLTDKQHASIVVSYNFTNPHGLGIDNHILFLCDGSDGLKIFNATDVFHISQNPISHFKNIQATDVIPVNGLLFMIGDNGFYQYDYSDLQNIKLLSTINVKK